MHRNNYPEKLETNAFLALKRHARNVQRVLCEAACMHESPHETKNEMLCVINCITQGCPSRVHATGTTENLFPDSN